jgi:hypothetical protein
MKPIYIACFVLILSSCYKKPMACFELDADTFLVNGDVGVNCSSNYEYLTWVFDDSSASELDEPIIRYDGEGYHDVILRCYSKDGRKMDETSVNVFKGYMYIDSLVVFHITDEVLQQSGANGQVENMRLKFGDLTAIETYSNPTTQDLPLVYTFQHDAHFTTRQVGFKLYEEIEIPDGPIINDNLYPYSGDTIGTSSYTARIYWHLNK